MPDRETLATCFRNNPDGAGFMWMNGPRVHWAKGFMTFDDLMAALDKAPVGKDSLLAIHFRISTAGGISPGNTHPFPVSKDEAELVRLTGEADNAVMHNGILGQGKGALSDTMVYTRNVLANLIGLIGHPNVFDAIANTSAGSRLLIFTKEMYYTTGEWVEDKATGLWYSNETYKPAYYHSYTHKWKDEWWDGYGADRWKDKFTQCWNCKSWLTREELDETLGVCPFCYEDAEGESEFDTFLKNDDQCPYCKSTEIYETDGFFYCEACGSQWKCAEKGD